ncbi:hypothetical protein BJ138DRAFT_541977 [Hygrophoropsis aurantiaca]|uniref:Uncharacterized protein n=1 Tax=Hygrophoropsis aurantiaca TaxID=72124 RepID=A0ACB8A292_9AGAM|nr:hypothetical protein BJ138DRAFT_541977 [Hygrophoropsis aurantiaca]
MNNAGTMEIEYTEYINKCFREIFRHSCRTRSFRLLFKYWVNLLEGASVPIPSFPRLEELKVNSGLAKHFPISLDPFLNSPRLQQVSWLCRQYPEPLIRIGAQITQLTYPDLVYYVDEKITALLRAFPNLTYLDVCRKGHVPFDLDIPVHPRNLHTFRSSEIVLHLGIAPNLRHLILELSLGNCTCLPQFLSQSPQIECLDLNISCCVLPDSPIFQFAPLSPCLVTLNITFRTVPSVLTLEKAFEMLTRTANLTSTLPKLQHFTLNVPCFGHTLVPLNSEMLLRMLESRCNYGQTFPDSAPTVAALRSCTINREDREGNPVHDSSLYQMADARRRLKMLQNHGLVLEGNTFTSILDDHRLL